MRTSIIAVVCLLSPAFAQHNTLSDQESGAGWQLLFDGESLDGFTTSGDLDAWGVIEGEIAVVDPGKGWWLRTDRMFRDFELTLDFKISEDGNSGVGLRGSSTGDPAFTGMEVQIYDNFGEEPTRSSCGAVYNAIPPETQAVKPAGEWNTYRIQLLGDTLNVWLNGVQIHTDAKINSRGIFRNDDQPLPLNERLTTGYISFQDHGEGGLRLRNIKIRDHSPDPDSGGYTDAFNGRDTTGWTHRGGGTFTFENGTLIAADGPGHLFSDAKHTDIEFRAFVRVNTKGNGGLYFRTVPRPEDPDTWPLGYEAQIDHHDPKNFTGCIYDRAWPAITSPITRDNRWFDYRVVVEGDTVMTFINGQPLLNARLDEFREGHIAIQTHHKGNRIEIRDFQWKKP